VEIIAVARIAVPAAARVPALLDPARLRRRKSLLCRMMTIFPFKLPVTC
jgi:hypothetical protein